MSLNFVRQIAGLCALAALAGAVPAAGLETNRLNLERVSSLNATGTWFSLRGSTLFLTPASAKAAPGGAWFDIASNPGQPVLLGSPLPPAWDVALVGNQALVCDGTKFLTVYDTRDHQWQLATRLPMSNITENIVVRGKHAFIAIDNSGLAILDITTPQEPKLVTILDLHIDCDALAFWRDTLVLYGHHQGQVVLVDVSDPKQPRPTGACQLPKILNGGELEVADGFAYVTSRRGLFILNLADPAQPALVKTVDFGGVAHDLSLLDAYAFVAADTNGVRVLDVRDPLHPMAVGNFPSTSEFVPVSLAVARASGQTTAASADYYLYVASKTGPAMVLRFHAPHRH